MQLRELENVRAAVLRAVARLAGRRTVQIIQRQLNHRKHLRGMKGIEIWINIKMQTGIKYIPALESFMARDYLKQIVHLKKNTNARNAAEK